MTSLTVFAMTEKGYSVITSLHASYPDIIHTVIAAKDAGIAEDYFYKIETFCRNNGIRFYSRQDSYSVETKYAIAISWRWLIDTSFTRLIVFHDSILPRYRGFNPLVTALINGDNEIGVTALYATQEYDKGPIIACSKVAIEYPICIKDAITLISANYKALAQQIASYLVNGIELPEIPQSEADASYSLWRDEEDYFIDWTASATAIKRTVDALGFPYKGAASTINDEIVRILKAEALEDIEIANRVPGKVIFVQDSKPVVVCGQGLLRVDELLNESGASILPLSRFRVRFKSPVR